MNCTLIFRIWIWTAALVLLNGCGKDDPVRPSGARFQKGQGVFITQEGSFTSGNGVLSYYDFIRDTLMEGVFEEANGSVVGSVLQGAFFENNDAYLVINGSGAIIQIDPSTGRQLSVLANLRSPNDFLVHEERTAYLSDLFGPHVYQIDLTRGEITDSLNAGGGTGEILVAEGHLFVTKTTDFGAPPSTSVFVANLDPFAWVDTIEVGYNPSAIIRDGENMIWVMSNGNSFEGRRGSLHRIDPIKREVVVSIDFPDLNTSYAARLEASQDGREIFFLKGDVFRIQLSDTEFPAQPLIESSGKSLYGLGIRPGNGDIYLGIEDFITESRVLIYNTDGSLIRELDSQVGTNHFYFY